VQNPHGATAAFTGPDLQVQRRAWYTYTWAAHVFETIVVSVFLSQYLPAVAADAVGENGRVRFLWFRIVPKALFVDVVTFSAVVLIVLMPIVGAMADRFRLKKQMLLTFGFLGAASCAAMWFIGPAMWQLGVALTIAAYLTYTCGKVISNSMLPDLAGAADRDRISSRGWAFGYVGSGILLAVNLGMSFFIDDKAMLARVSLGLAGLWWAAFALIPLVRMRNAPHPATSMAEQGSVLIAGFRQLGRTFRHLRAYPMTLLFLVAYLIYYDGITTVTLLAAQFGGDELKLSQTVLLTAILVVQFAAFAGALLLGRFAVRWGAKRVVAWSLVVWCLVVTGAYFLQVGVAWQFYVLAVVLSLVLGGSQALSRSLFSNMIPVGMEAEYFSFFEVSGSGSSIFGTLLFGITVQVTGSFRGGILSLIVLFIVGLGLLLLVDVPRAVAAAGNALPASLGGRRREPAAADVT
jgi:UMF1 family MFS transporter